MEPNFGAQIIGLFIRIGITIYCVNKAERLNRSQFGWGIFAFFIPLLALIWIFFMKPKMEWESNLQISQNNEVDVL